MQTVQKNQTDMTAEIDRSRLSPMMRLYLETKDEYRDCILFYRLGDFYEMFFSDAITVSKELELTLTGKACGLDERAPMCGVPFHAAENYINRLVERGYKVAICEQVEDPKQAKGLVKREVIRVVTPGTNLYQGALDEGRHNYIMCVVLSGEMYGISVADISTADYLVTEVDSVRKLYDEISKFSPSEIICNEGLLLSGLDTDDLSDRLNIRIYPLDAWYFSNETSHGILKEHFHVQSLAGLGLIDFDCGTTAAGALLKYLYETQKTSLDHMTHIIPYQTGTFMVLDSATRRNLELTETLREKQKRGSLLWVLDKTKTAMGARMLRSFLEQPLIEKEAIEARLSAVSELKQNLISREELREYLNPVYDLERLLSRMVYQSANPRDLVAFRNSISMIPAIKMILGEFSSELLEKLNDEMDPLTDLCDLITQAINEDPPITVREAGIIRDGYHEEVDHLREAKTKGRSWLSKIEEEEREKTGIKNLKIKYNKVFGYYLEVTNSYRDMVPDYFIRKQTLTNAERYITPDLKELEDTILTASDKLNALEYELFTEVRDRVAKEVTAIQKTAHAIAMVDALLSLAHVADANGYHRPKINASGSIRIKNGRHPVVEKMMGGELFIPNDMALDNKNKRIAIITGPNMAGKSTYMRQNALIVLMAQIGSFVPAESASIGIVDRIFTRVGASDDLASGQSTFMVEMTEVANILRSATQNSLLILDEIGRGTSTIDGLSIAWAVVEYISDKKLLGAKTLFATHYHELTELEGKLKDVNNYCIAVKERGDDIAFLRKIVPGGADRSYGIQVAKLAGVPETVINRAKEICEELEKSERENIVKNLDARNDLSKTTQKTPDEVEMGQFSLFDTMQDDTIIEEIKNLDLPSMTPLDALNKLNEIQSKIKNRW